MGQYLPIVAMIVLAALFAALSFVASSLLQPRRPTEAKVAPYECGIVDQTDPPERFPVRFFLIAMIFIVFDIEIIFVDPVTMVAEQLGGFGLVAIGIFAAAVVESFLHLIRTGALDWGPVVRARRSALRSMPARTTTSTIRRVGTEGRAADGTEVAA